MEEKSTHTKNCLRYKNESVGETCDLTLERLHEFFVLESGGRKRKSRWGDQKDTVPPPQQMQPTPIHLLPPPAFINTKLQPPPGIGNEALAHQGRVSDPYQKC